MSFVGGFLKVAGTIEGLTRGVRAAGGETIKDALTMKGLRASVKDLHSRYKGKGKELLTTHLGRGDLAEAVGKSLPSVAAGGLYAAAAKKSLDTLKRDSQNQYDTTYYGR